MEKFFGPASAAQVDNMDEETCVSQCKEKVLAFLGPGKASEFDNI